MYSKAACEVQNVVGLLFLGSHHFLVATVLWNDLRIHRYRKQEVETQYSHVTMFGESSVWS